MATSPDFPELTTFGDDRAAAAVARAVQGLEEAIAPNQPRMANGSDFGDSGEGMHRL